MRDAAADILLCQMKSCLLHLNPSQRLGNFEFRSTRKTVYSLTHRSCFLAAACGFLLSCFLSRHSSAFTNKLDAQAHVP